MANSDTIRPSAAYLGVIHFIDTITDWSSKLFMLLIVPLIFANVVEVVSRYFFGDPTVWALDMTTMAFGAMFMLGSAFALLKGAHVRTDMLWDKFSERKKGIIDSCAYIFFFLPSMAAIAYIGWEGFAYSYSLGEYQREV
ncbi:MAG TPA: TRAP transporter small permease subunit [Hyphomicrobiaceae bacterium]|nr:TRAP transporter small permease subunit [Hyphomicrobiaceae bacterium]